MKTYELLLKRFWDSGLKNRLMDSTKAQADFRNAGQTGSILIPYWSTHALVVAYGAGSPGSPGTNFVSNASTGGAGGNPGGRTTQFLPVSSFGTPGFTNVSFQVGIGTYGGSAPLRDTFFGGLKVPGGSGITDLSGSDSRQNVPGGAIVYSGPGAGGRGVGYSGASLVSGYAAQVANSAYNGNGIVDGSGGAGGPIAGSVGSDGGSYGGGGGGGAGGNSTIPSGSLGGNGGPGLLIVLWLR
jgi:hypothetical protein